MLATTESLLDPAHLDAARRITATHLPWSDANVPWSLTGLLAPGGLLTTTVDLAYDDQSSNPFLHTYHPDHDNLDATFQTELAQGYESYRITRQITLNVSPPGNDFGSLTSAAQSLVGYYAETMSLGGTGRIGADLLRERHLRFEPDQHHFKTQPAINVKTHTQRPAAREELNFPLFQTNSQSRTMKTRNPLAAACRSLLPLLLLLALAVTRAQAQPSQYPPGQISYQGFLVDANGIPLATNAPKNYDLIFRIYNSPNTATPLWGELQTVTLDRGYFSVLLGQGSSVPGSPSTNHRTGLFLASDASARYIGVTVNGLAGGNVEIQPRMRLLASPYSLLAHNANNAVKLGGYDWSNLFPDTGIPTTGTIPGTKLAANSVTAAQIANGAVGSAQIANGAVGAAQIANGGVGTAQIANGAVGGAQIGWPLYDSGGYGHYYFLSGQPAGVLELNNTYVSSFPFFADYGISVQAESAIYATSHAGSTAYIADGSYAAELYGTVYVSGNMTVAGTLSKSAGSFKIDHPLDPANKYLSHSFVESPDMKNMYDGVATLDANGEAVVELPDWFEALNKDFRYQLTAIGGAAPNLHIKQKVSGNRFAIAGGGQGLEVSWQVTGTRHDAYADAHRIPVEELKTLAERGTYLNPEEQGQSPDKGLLQARHPASQTAQK